MSTKKELNLRLEGLRTSEYGWSNSDCAGIASRDISGNPMTRRGLDLTGIAFQNTPHVRGGAAL